MKITDDPLILDALNRIARKQQRGVSITEPLQKLAAENAYVLKLWETSRKRHTTVTIPADALDAFALIVKAIYEAAHGTFYENDLASRKALRSDLDSWKALRDEDH